MSFSERVKEEELEPKHNYGPFEENPTGKLRGVAAILAFIVGGFGVHMFYLGQKGAGVQLLLMTILAQLLAFFDYLDIISLALLIIILVTCIKHGIQLLRMSYEEFADKYFEFE